MELGEKPSPSSETKTCLPSLRLTLPRVKTTSLTNYIFFDPLHTLSRVRISLVATFLPHTLDWVHLAPCGPAPLKEHSSRTIRIPITINILGIGKFLHKSYPINLTLISSLPFPRRHCPLLRKQASLILLTLLKKGLLGSLHIISLTYPSSMTP